MIEEKKPLNEQIRDAINNSPYTLHEFTQLMGIKLKILESFIDGSLIPEKKNISKKYPYCPIVLGVSFLDQIRNLENFKKITFNKISFPLLILPFLSKSSEIIGKKIKVSFNNFEFLLNFNVNISSNLLKKKLPEICENIEINIIENKDNFSDQEWKNLYKLSEETFVEENDSLKKGAAGAGLTDND